MVWPVIGKWQAMTPDFPERLPSRARMSNEDVLIVTCMAAAAMRRPAGTRPQSRWHCGHIICNPLRRQEFRRGGVPAIEVNHIV
jgi:hypothetical protein